MANRFVVNQFVIIFWIWAKINASVTNSILISPAQAFYVNKTTPAKAKKPISSTRFGSYPSNHERTRVFQDNHSKKVVKKYSPPSVNGNWGNWGEYGPPSKTCDEGFRSRVRECNNPPPSGMGKDCEGKPKETLLFEFGRCVLKKLDTEFNDYNMGMWKPVEATPGFYWTVKHAWSEDATGDGFYLLADSSWRNREDKAIIISDMLTPAPKVNRACLKFRYRMPGETGLLSIKIQRYSKQPKDIWSVYGNQGEQWVKNRVTLKSSVKFQVLFVAAVGTPHQSDIALDNIYVDNGPCKCQDEFESCREWAAKGECKATEDMETYYWMVKNCKTSCNSCDCRDSSRECRRWAQEGYCSNHLVWMSGNCQMSCGLCACRDILEHSDCQARVGSYECESEPKWMAGKCKLSCGFCGCTDVLTEEECQRRMMVGECQSNPVYMSSNCKHSCGCCNCRNRDSKCSTWAEQGECERYEFWMDIFCTLSCGKCDCHDRTTRCKKWKEDGECFHNPLYMNAFCPKSCEICRENTNGVKNSRTNAIGRVS